MATEFLTTEECMRLLGTQSVGRLAVVVAGYPTVVPLNFALDRGTVVFRSAPGTKLDAAQHGNVAFQVDEIDHQSRSGWSVLLTGMAEIIGDQHDEELVARTTSLNIDPYEPGDKTTWVRIITNSVTGRRITQADLVYVEEGFEPETWSSLPV